MEQEPEPERDAMEAHAACESKPRPGDGRQAWLGLLVAVVVAVVMAVVLGVVLLRWLA